MFIILLMLDAALGAYAFVRSGSDTVLLGVIIIMAFICGMWAEREKSDEPAAELYVPAGPLPPPSPEMQLGEYRKEPCLYCEGKGTVGKFDSCPVCGGTGNV